MKMAAKYLIFMHRRLACGGNHRLPPMIRNIETEKTRNYFQSKSVTELTSDVVLAYGSKK